MRITGLIIGVALIAAGCSGDKVTSPANTAGTTMRLPAGNYNSNAARFSQSQTEEISNSQKGETVTVRGTYFDDADKCLFLQVDKATTVELRFTGTIKPPMIKSGTRAEAIGYWALELGSQCQTGDPILIVQKLLTNTGSDVAPTTRDAAGM